MKIMAIDYGDAHTGIAVSDALLTLAGFTTVITAYRPEAVIEKLLPLISEHEVSELVLGHPLNMDGTRGPRAEKAEGFALYSSHILHRITENMLTTPPCLCYYCLAIMRV